jgi:hypothetical protein
MPARVLFNPVAVWKINPVAVWKRALPVALASAALCLPAGAAMASPARGNGCEALTGTDGGQTVCIGTLPSSRSKVVLKSQNGSGEHGVAVVTFGFHETKVVITLNGAPAGVGQPARIRRGGCFGPTVSSLGNIVNGKHSVKIGPLPHVSGYSIVVHSSTAPGAGIVACGVIPPHHKSR